MRRTWQSISWAAVALSMVAAAPRARALILPETQQSPSARLLLRLEDGWAAALVRRDEAYFRRYLAQGFVYTEDDKTMDRATILRELHATTDTVEAAHNEEMVVHLFGES